MPLSTALLHFCDSFVTRAGFVTCVLSQAEHMSLRGQAVRRPSMTLACGASSSALLAGSHTVKELPCPGVEAISSLPS